ncbi:MAG: phosphoribosylglycinamide formyltransferase, partial [Chloroflexi bacterium]|nr:phosphoribosylglycinamide formyltransferase [Chloroflexota bacterium]
MNSQEAKRPIAVLIGGGGRLQAIADYCQRPETAARIAIVVSHKRQSPGLEWARERGWPAVYWNLVHWRKQGGTREEFDEALARFLTQPNYSPELVVMAGWDLVLSARFLKHFARDGTYRVLNLHPALLPDGPGASYRCADGTVIPAFRGEDAIAAALKAGVPRTGCTVHIATPSFDEGPVVLRSEVPVLPGDSAESLGARIHAEEERILPQAIELFLRGRVRVEGGRVRVMG